MTGLPRYNIDAYLTAEWIRIDVNGTVLRIGPRGGLTGRRLTPGEAVKLAHWILDTYPTATMPVPEST